MQRKRYSSERLGNLGNMDLCDLWTYVLHILLICPLYVEEGNVVIDSCSNGKSNCSNISGFEKMI